MKKEMITIEYEEYKNHIKSLLADIRKEQDKNRLLESEIRDLKHFRFETNNYHGEVRKDFSWGWFEHIEYGEDGGCGNFDIELNDTYWEIVDTDGCYDLPVEVYEMLENRITVPQLQS